MRMAERPSADAIASTPGPVQAPTLVTYPARRPRESTLCATRAMSAPGMTVSTPATTAKATSCRSSHVPKSTAVSIRSAPLLLEVARLVGRRGQGVARARLLDERILDLLLREAVPLVVPGRLHVRPALGLRVLLAPHLEVPAGVLVALDHSRIEGSQLFVEELAAGCEDHRPELAEAVHVRLESLEDRIVGQARLLDGERRLLELLERDRRFVDACLPLYASASRLNGKMSRSSS